MTNESNIFHMSAATLFSDLVLVGGAFFLFVTH